MDLQKIKFLCERQGIGIKQLAVATGMSEPNLHRCIRLNKIQANDLEKVANVLKVPMEIFFDDSVSGVSEKSTTPEGDEIRFLQERVKYLEQIVQEKERLIKVLLDGKS